MTAAGKVKQCDGQLAVLESRGAGGLANNENRQNHGLVITLRSSSRAGLDDKLTNR